jgi:hypothetical protein
MRSVEESTSPSGRPPSQPPTRRTPPNAFSPEFLADARERDESLTTAEAEFSGPWKLEPLPGHPGWTGVLREWESLAEGDIPEAVFREEETGVICRVVLPLLEREPLEHLAKDPAAPAADSELPGGYPMVAMHGEEGPQVRGLLRRYNLRLAAAIHLVEGLHRSPAALAALLDAAGGEALEQVGRALVALRQER